MTNFSTKINGHDLRATIIDLLVGSDIEHVGSSDPATFADNLMVELGFDSGYNEHGEYAEGYRGYMRSVGLIAERRGLPIQWGQPPLRPGYRWPTKAEQNEVP